MKMMKLRRLLLLGCILITGYAFGGTDDVLTEKDLRGYKKTGDFVIPKQKTASEGETGKKVRGTRDDRGDQDYYCKRGNTFRRRIDEAKFDLAQEIGRAHV